MSTLEENLTLRYLFVLNQLDLCRDLVVYCARFFYALLLADTPPSFAVTLSSRPSGIGYERCDWERLVKWWEHFLGEYGAGSVPFYGDLPGIMDVRWNLQVGDRLLQYEENSVTVGHLVLGSGSLQEAGTVSLASFSDVEGYYRHIHESPRTAPSPGQKVSGDNYFILQFRCPGRLFLSGFLV
jgi:hypothetical protein